MLESGISNITMFFVIVGVAVLFVVVWIIKSESRVTIAKEQIKALRLRLEAGERERYMLSEKLSSIDGAPRPEQDVFGSEEPKLSSKDKPKKKSEDVSRAEEALKEETRKLKDALKARDALETENNKLKSELAEATASLAEVYKALCEK